MLDTRPNAGRRPMPRIAFNAYRFICIDTSTHTEAVRDMSYSLAVAAECRRLDTYQVL